MIALDASVLIAHLGPRDAHHAAGTAILLNSAPGSVLGHCLTLSGVLLGGVRVGRGGDARRHPRRRCSARQPTRRRAELRATTGLTLLDCGVLDVAIHHHATLATFDDALASAARRRGVVVLP